MRHRTHFDSRPAWLPASMLLAAMSLACAASASGQTTAPGAYFGLQPPAQTPEVFAPGIINIPGRSVGRLAFSLDGTECCFGVFTGIYVRQSLLFTRYENGAWTPQTPLPLVNGQTGFEPLFSRDGTQLYMSVFTAGTPSNMDFWVAQRQGQGWSPPQILPAPMNSPLNEFCLAQAADGTTFFASRRDGGLGGLDIYRAVTPPGQALQVVNEGAPVNSIYNDGDPAISPDGSTLVFYSVPSRPGVLGGSDLFICFEDGEGGWTTPVHMGAEFNTPVDEYAATFSQDGLVFFFTRFDGIKGEPYWVSTAAMERFRFRFVQQPGDQTAAAGNAATFTVAAGYPSAASFQWQVTTDGGATWNNLTDGVPYLGVTSDKLSITTVTSPMNGYKFRCLGSSTAGNATSSAVTLTVTPQLSSSARLLNLSTRALCLTGDDVMIPGFVLSGSGTRRLLIRGIGPSLGLPPINLAGGLADPQMTLRLGSTILGTNDDWGTNANAAEIKSAFAAVGAFDLPDQSTDSAMLLDLSAGAYTAVTNGAANGTGVAIVELYDVSGAGPALVNISTRGFVGVGDNIMIPGFVVSSEGSRTFLIRAVGPELGLPPFNLPTVLPDPVLTVFSGQNPILSNDDWGTSADATSIATAAATVSAFALSAGSKDAALVATLPPGAYTVHASGKGGATGTAIVEVYLVP